MNSTEKVNSLNPRSQKHSVKQIELNNWHIKKPNGLGGNSKKSAQTLNSLYNQLVKNATNNEESSKRCSNNYKTSMLSTTMIKAE